MEGIWGIWLDMGIYGSHDAQVGARPLPKYCRLSIPPPTPSIPPFRIQGTHILESPLAPKESEKKAKTKATANGNGNRAKTTLKQRQKLKHS